MRRGVGLFVVALLTSCGHRVEGLHVQVEATISQPLTTLTTAGTPVAIRHAQLEIAFIELVPCPDAMAAFLGWLRPIGVAHAHGDGDALRSVANVSVRLETPGTQLLGDIFPPPGDYCELQALVAPASASGDSLAVSGVDANGRLLESHAAAVRKFSISRQTIQVNATRRLRSARVEVQAQHWLNELNFEGESLTPTGQASPP